MRELGDQEVELYDEIGHFIHPDEVVFVYLWAASELKLQMKPKSISLLGKYLQWSLKMK